MKLRQRFLTSIYKFDEYYELIKTTAGSSLLYYFLISLLTTVIMAFSVVPALSQVYGLIAENVPEFVIQDGKLTAEDVIDIDVGGTIIKMDASADDVEELTSEEDYDQGIFISGSEILVESKLADIYSRTSLEEFEGFDNYALSAVINIIKYVSYGILILFFILSKLVLLLFVWLLGKLMSNILRGGLNFTDSFKLGIYASTTAAILKAVLTVFSLSMHNYIFFGIILAYMYFGLDSCKKHKDDFQQETL
ncbi:MAG: DUF1189 domain-containing protein [Clostridiales bacterium]|nr:DUF1189 domain-containing protein [Clostridiales bacterium]